MGVQATNSAGSSGCSGPKPEGPVSRTGRPNVGSLTRPRRAEDWDRDLAGARAVERQVAAALDADRRVHDLADRTASFESLDFFFTYRSMTVTVDVKEKRQRYSSGIRGLWPEIDERDLFVVDETVFRRVVWQGGGGYLLVHDLPVGRWAVFGPWELTLGHRVRYGRWGRRHGGSPFLKGKLLLDLSTASETTAELSVDAILRTVDVARRWRSRVEPFPISGARLHELGS